MEAATAIDFAPAARLGLLALLLASVPLSWLWLRRLRRDRLSMLAALTALTLVLTFDLVVFGAFTRLSDSGLGCPDWPGCYGQATPVGAHGNIHAAQSAAPGGPVTWTKAWIEMIHRYLAMTVGLMIVVMAALAWRERKRLPFSVAWPLATLAWVVAQGLLGKYTVTWKLYPAIVTLHLLGGLTLMALLARQHAAFLRSRAGSSSALSPGLRPLAIAGLGVVVMQTALGGWVSSNYAVLACAGFPQCNGAWWPEMDASRGFTVLRGLGEGVNLGALVAIHMAHRLFALLVLAVATLLAWRLWRAGSASARRHARVLAVLLAAQFISGVSNVVLGWPLAAALAHSAGAASLVLSLVLLLTPGGSRLAAAAAAPGALRA